MNIISKSQPFFYRSPTIMNNKISSSFLLTILFIITTFTFILTSLLLYNLFPQPPSAAAATQCARRPLRVFMYDLPRKFNVRMFDRHNTSDHDMNGPVTAADFPPWPAEETIHTKQHSMEYWLMASLFYDDRDGEREAVRVMDPEMADAFFVPVFTALSFYSIKLIWPWNWQAKEDELKDELVEILHRSKYWQRSRGRDHVIPMTFPWNVESLRRELNESIFIVVDFSSQPHNISYLRKDVVAPYAHLAQPFVDDDPQDPFDSRTMLLFFRGYTDRRDEGKIRLKLAEVLAGHEGVHYEHRLATTKAAMKSAMDMRLSKFCLSPVGDTPSSCRLFDAIVSHCVPVIVSDHIELPYEDELDYSEFSIFFSMEEALRPNYIVDQLRQVPKAKWMNMWWRLKEISHHFEFQYPPKKDDAVDMLWKQVKHKLPRVWLDVHRSRRLQLSS